MQNDISFWKKFIELNLNYNIDYMVENSIKDFHFKGLNYICFQFMPHLTVRLYVIEPSEPVDTKNVNIHNHLYDSQILVLTSSITNNVYKKIDGEDYNHYYLTSALCPTNESKKIKLDTLGKCSLEQIKSIQLFPGDSHFQDHTEIHNVENDTTKLTAFMVFEFPTVKHNSILFSKKDYGKTIPTDNCYNRFSATEIKKHWEEVEPGYFDRNRKFIDKDGWLNANMFFFKKLTKKGEKLIDVKDGCFLRPKTLGVVLNGA